MTLKDFIKSVEEDKTIGVYMRHNDNALQDIQIIVGNKVSLSFLGYKLLEAKVIESVKQSQYNMCVIDINECYPKWSGMYYTR